MYDMKDVVFSWRITARLKSELMHEAQKRGMSASRLLERALDDFLTRSRSPADDDGEEQRRLREAAAKHFGTIDSGRSDLAENASAIVRERLRKRYGR
jgi:hypothetical protein